MEKRELDAVNIGEKIQAYRQQKGLNIKELSRLCLLYTSRCV